MALPSAFDNAVEYIEEAMRFLKDIQLYYNYRNTDILIEGIIDKINIQDLEQYSVFDEDFNVGDIPELKPLVDRVNKLRCAHTRLELEGAESVYFENVPLGSKKKHEICFLSQEIHAICQENGCETIIDFGCGLGYLDQLLHKKFKYRILGLESNENIARGARKRQRMYHSDSKRDVIYANHYVDESSVAVIESLLEEHFPMSKNVCIVGLHACADLTVNAINIFLKMHKAKSLVLMPCCYHKMSLKVSEVPEYEVNNVNPSGNFNCKADNEGNGKKKPNEDITDASNSQNDCKLREKDESRTDIPNEMGNTKSSDDPIASSMKCHRFCNFPLSDTFKLICTASDGCGYLRIPFLRLAAQPPSVGEDLNILVFRLLSRAVLQMYCHKRNQSLRKKKRRPVKLKYQTNEFRVYIEYVTLEGYSVECESCMPVNKFSVQKTLDTFLKPCKCDAGFDMEELMEMWQHYCTDLAMRKAAILILLQRFLQPMFENLILFDRIMYLRDMGIDNSNFVKVLDERISPRCLALVASK